MTPSQGRSFGAATAGEARSDSWASIDSHREAATVRVAPTKSGGATPMMSKTRLFSRIVRSSIDGSESKCCRHNRWPMMAVDADGATPASVPKSRPSSRGTLNIPK